MMFYSTIASFLLYRRSSIELTAGRIKLGRRTTAMLYGVILFDAERGMTSSIKN